MRYLKSVHLDDYQKAVKEIEQLQAHLSRIQALVNNQAEDDMLWFKAERITEAHLQQELRRLHAVIEGG